MKKALLVAAALVAIVLIGSSCMVGYFSKKETRAANVAWSASLGSLADAPAHFPLAKQSAGATKLIALASRAHIDLAPRYHARDADKVMKPDMRGAAVRKELGDYIKAQFERSSDAIDAPPALAAQYLSENEAALNAVRDQLLSGAPIVWDTELEKGFDQPLPNLLGIMHLQRALSARALDKARHNDPAAWDDLHASWELSRSLWRRPDLISILIALATTRMSNAAARKMPLPAPAWLGETYSFDYLHAMAASQQAEAWTIHHAQRPAWYVFDRAEALDVMRTYTDEAVRARACDADSTQFAPARAAMMTKNMAVPNLMAAWRRLMRFRVELEATERVLQLRAGQTPSPQSQCSDGTWQVTSNSIRFSKDVKVPPPGMHIPLEYVR